MNERCLTFKENEVTGWKEIRAIARAFGRYILHFIHSHFAQASKLMNERFKKGTENGK